ncbi:unnamed protein product [Linum trigynum]|uniref:Uncharacterized protein n=1 Tax=Linum trigynum TaxID=586398 RepID=A0AAV2EIS5_9ROSI
MCDSDDELAVGIPRRKFDLRLGEHPVLASGRVPECDFLVRIAEREQSVAAVEDLGSEHVSFERVVQLRCGGVEAFEVHGGEKTAVDSRRLAVAEARTYLGRYCSHGRR